MIEPVSDALTTVISPAWSAKNAMISSAMLPKVALRMPPTCGPVSAPSRSVDRPTIHARPRIAIADTTNTVAPSTWRPKSRAIAIADMTSVAMIATRATGDTAPRTGDGRAGGGRRVGHAGMLPGAPRHGTARSLRAAAAATRDTRAARVSGRMAVAIHARSIRRAEGGNASKLAAAAS